jgi:hypothetical protein
MKKTASDEKPQAPKSSGSAGGQAARVLVILGVNAAVVLAAALVAGEHKLPDFTHSTLAVGLLPVSAAFGLILVCRRIDFTLPLLLVLAGNLPHSAPWLPSDKFLQLLSVAGILAAIGLASALVTWYGRLSSALWTALAALLLYGLVHSPQILDHASGPWPWPWAVGISLGLLVVGAAVLGRAGLVSPPSTPPIMHVGSSGLAGLAAAWMLAAASLALAAQADLAITMDEVPPASYGNVLAAGALGGAVILRGRWGALAAVALAGVAHVCWTYVGHVQMACPPAHVLIKFAAPAAAVPLYLAIDWLIRRWTGESTPTGLLA